MNDIFAGGKIGEAFAAMAFASALIATITYFRAEYSPKSAKASWERLAATSFLAHIIGILGIIGTLFFLIYTHQYQYYYVYDHSSNELPVYYMISCFWEGQEGSFLLWCFWHCVLGAILMRSKTEWKNMVMGIVASVEMILVSMILGIYVGASSVSIIYGLMLGLPLAYFIWRYTKRNEYALEARQSTLYVGAGMLALISGVLLLREQAGFMADYKLGSGFGLNTIGLSLFILTVLGVFLLFTRVINHREGDRRFASTDMIFGLSILMVAVISIWFGIDTWKLGSNPFISIRDAFPDDPTLLANPDYIPANGRGLNSLLQNYWMVIHPPTLFLGFASTLIPFGFVMAGLIKGKYREWIKEAMPWTTFSIMILGVGIIMGGYWAYETLNFGGYWNWDPVENSSFVPWLCGVAGLHAMLIHQRSKSYLKLTLLLIISTFLLVLYSTFLTRSGILGDTSVHTFTDLGLSGQLLVLVFIYVAWVFVMMLSRWKDIPEKEESSKLWSAEFMLFLGVLVLVFSSADIILTTSLPVFNTILGTKLAPPVNLQLFYYKWNVWFAIGFGVLSAMGQFLWWNLKQKESVANALYRPFVISMVAGSVILLLMGYYRMEFAFDKTFKAIIAPGSMGTSFFDKAVAYLSYGLVDFADEILLFSSLFGLMANIDVLISMLRKNKKRLKVMGGTVVHIGFALMLLGMLFSSGYDKVISKNIAPEELAMFPEEERIDNVALLRGRSRQIQGYQVMYLGKKEAEAPISKLRLLEENKEAFKISFEDKKGETFGMVLPRNVFLKEEKKHTDGSVQPVVDTKVVGGSKELEGELDFKYTEDFLNTNLETIRPKHLNGRDYYGVRFTSMKDTAKNFTLYPEAEENEQMGGMISHPNRKSYWDRDIYTFVSSVPPDDAQRPQYRYHERMMRIGDTAMIGNIQILLGRIRDMARQREDLKQYQVAAVADILVITRFQDTLLANPIYLIDENNQRGMIESKVGEVFMDFAFVDINPQNGSMRIQIQEQTNPFSDVIVIKAIEKPFINLLWLGTFILAFGFMISIYRRVQENRKRT